MPTRRTRFLTDEELKTRGKQWILTEAALDIELFDPATKRWIEDGTITLYTASDEAFDHTGNFLMVYKPHTFAQIWRYEPDYVGTAGVGDRKWETFLGEFRPKDAVPDLIDSISVHQDTKRLVLTSLDNAATVWTLNDMFQWTQEGSLAHDDTVRHAFFSPTGERIVTVSDDTTAKVWHFDPQKKIWRQEAVLAGHTLPVRTATFSPREDHIATASDDGTIRLWVFKDNAWHEEGIVTDSLKDVQTLQFGPHYTMLAAKTIAGETHPYNFDPQEKHWSSSQPVLFEYISGLVPVLERTGQLSVMQGNLIKKILQRLRINIASPYGLTTTEKNSYDLLPEHLKDFLKTYIKSDTLKTPRPDTMLQQQLAHLQALPGELQEPIALEALKGIVTNIPPATATQLAQFKGNPLFYGLFDAQGKTFVGSYGEVPHIASWDKLSTTGAWQKSRTEKPAHQLQAPSRKARRIIMNQNGTALVVLDNVVGDLQPAALYTRAGTGPWQGGKLLQEKQDDLAPVRTVVDATFVTDSLLLTIEQDTSQDRTIYVVRPWTIVSETGQFSAEPIILSTTQELTKIIADPKGSQFALFGHNYLAFFRQETTRSYVPFFTREWTRWVSVPISREISDQTTTPLQGAFSNDGNSFAIAGNSISVLGKDSRGWTVSQSLQGTTPVSHVYFTGQDSLVSQHPVFSTNRNEDIIKVWKYTNDSGWSVINTLHIFSNEFTSRRDAIGSLSLPSLKPDGSFFLVSHAALQKAPHHEMNLKNDGDDNTYLIRYNAAKVVRYDAAQNSWETIALLPIPISAMIGLTVLIAPDGASAITYNTEGEACLKAYNLDNKYAQYKLAVRNLHGKEPIVSALAAAFLGAVHKFLAQHPEDRFPYNPDLKAAYEDLGSSIRKAITPYLDEKYHISEQGATFLDALHNFLEHHPEDRFPYNPDLKAAYDDLDRSIQKALAPYLDAQYHTLEGQVTA